jgi:hypothetical protein
LLIALKKYPAFINGNRTPFSSLSFPKYPLLMPEVNSATPSNMPISKTEKPISFK